MESSDIVGPPVGVLLVLTSMAGDAPQACRSKGGFLCFADGRPPSVVLVVRGHVPDAGVEADPIPALPVSVATAGGPDPRRVRRHRPEQSRAAVEAAHHLESGRLTGPRAQRNVVVVRRSIEWR